MKDAVVVCRAISIPIKAKAVKCWTITPVNDMKEHSVCVTVRIEQPGPILFQLRLYFLRSLANLSDAATARAKVADICCC